MRQINRIFTFLICGILFFVTGKGLMAQDGNKRLKIGITLHPYYSFVKNIVGDKADVIPLIGEGFNPHAYKPQPTDIKKISELDALVVNGIGHDEFAFEILQASRMKGKIPLIYANKGVSLIPIAGTAAGIKSVNPHTFISVTASIQQIYNIRNHLSKLDPSNAKVYRMNTRAYVKKLRKMKAHYMKKLAGITDLDFRCATIHGGYDYLLQEFGLQVTAVIEPAHGLKPTASQLTKTIDKIKQLGVDVIFTEMNLEDKYVNTIERETGIRIRYLSHLTSGTYTAKGFEEGLRNNLEALTNAITESYSKKHLTQNHSSNS